MNKVKFFSRKFVFQKKLSCLDSIPEASRSSSVERGLLSTPFTALSEISKTGTSSSPRDFILIIHLHQLKKKEREKEKKPNF